MCKVAMLIREKKTSSVLSHGQANSMPTRLASARVNGTGKWLFCFEGINSNPARVPNGL
jgi:hypothetical protein